MPAVLRAGRRAWWLAALLFSAPVAAQLAERCASCHGPGGNSVTPGIPSIAAQPKVFLENLLILMREGVRGSAAMQQQMKGVSDREIIALATHFAKLPPALHERRVGSARFRARRQLRIMRGKGDDVAVAHALHHLLQRHAAAQSFAHEDEQILDEDFGLRGD